MALANGVDVLNNSWGYINPFSDNFDNPSNAAVAQALEDLALDGRGGLGTAVTFSAGNSGHQADNVNGPHSYSFLLPARHPDGS